MLQYNIIYILILQHTDKAIQRGTVEPPFNIPWYEVSSDLMFDFNDLKTIIIVLNNSHFRFYSVWCTKETFNGHFTA
jgi:hypothetical protein